MRIANGTPQPFTNNSTTCDTQTPSEMEVSSPPKRDRPTDKGKRSVRFSSSATIYHVLDMPVLSDMTAEEIDNRWYSSTDMRSFVISAKKACTNYIEGSNSSNKTTSSEEEADEENMRGLDHQVSLIRKKKKEMAINVILECQRRLRFRVVTQKPTVDKATYLALVSAKVTKFARDIAFRTALKDFITAYPERKINIASVLGPTVISPQNVSRKRKTTTKVTVLNQSQGRRVRMKVIYETEQINSQPALLRVP